MTKVDDAKEILGELGMPRPQRNVTAAHTLLAFAAIGPRTRWDRAKAVRTNPHGVIEFARRRYAKDYAENTRETIRRQAIHQFVQGGILERNPDDPGLATNSPKSHYALTDEALEVLRSYGTPRFQEIAAKFRSDAGGGLAERYAKRRSHTKIPVTLPGGGEEFLPRFWRWSGPALSRGHGGQDALCRPRRPESHRCSPTARLHQSARQS